jgi:methionyl-tRNA formyltransferase
MFGSTAHRIEDGYDTGEVLSLESEELPEMVTDSTAVRWGELIKKCIANGMERAISGKSGIIQNSAQATYAPLFTEEEKWVDLHEPTRLVLRKTLALNLTGGLAKAYINGRVHKIHSAHDMPSCGRIHSGSVIKQENGVYEVATADGAVKLVTELFDTNKKYANVLPCSAFFQQPIGSEHLNAMRL